MPAIRGIRMTDHSSHTVKWHIARLVTLSKLWQL